MAPDLAENGTNFRRARGGEMRKILTLPVSVMKIVMPTTQHSGHPIWAIYKDLGAKKSKIPHARFVIPKGTLTVRPRGHVGSVVRYLTST